MRAWFSTWTTPSASKLLDQVVLLVVERRAAEVADRRASASPGSRQASRSASRLACRSIRSTIISIASSRRAPPTRVPYGRRYLTLYSRSGPLEALRRLALRAEAAARDRARRIAFDLRDLAVLHVHELRRSRPRSTGRPNRRHESALAIRGFNCLDCCDCAALPSPSGSPSASCRTSGRSSDGSTFTPLQSRGDVR